MLQYPSLDGRSGYGIRQTPGFPKQLPKTSYETQTEPNQLSPNPESHCAPEGRSADSKGLWCRIKPKAELRDGEP